MLPSFRNHKNIFFIFRVTLLDLPPRTLTNCQNFFSFFKNKKIDNFKPDHKESTKPLWVRNCHHIMYAYDSRFKYWCYISKIYWNTFCFLQIYQKRNLFDACAVEMEGAAIAHTATLNNVPFVIIRAISDLADNNASKRIVFTEEDNARICAKALEIILSIV